MLDSVADGLTALRLWSEGAHEGLPQVLGTVVGKDLLTGLHDILLDLWSPVALPHWQAGDSKDVLEKSVRLEWLIDQSFDQSVKLLLDHLLTDWV